MDIYITLASLPQAIQGLKSIGSFGGRVSLTPPGPAVQLVGTSTRIVASTGGTAPVVSSGLTVTNGVAFANSVATITNFFSMASSGGGEGDCGSTVSPKVSSPNGSTGNPDHQRTVRQLLVRAQKEFKGSRYQFRTNRSILDKSGVNRRPDVAVIDTMTNSVVKVYEAARTNKSGEFVIREVTKAEEYLDEGINFEFWEVIN